MEVKTRLAPDVPQPDLIVGLRCAGCESYVLNGIPLSKIVPRMLWGRAREALEGLDGDAREIGGTFYCDDCTETEGDADG